MGFFTRAFIRNIRARRMQIMVFISWMWRDVHVHTRCQTLSQTSCTLVRCAPVSDPTKRHGRGRPDRRPCPPLGVRPGASGCVYPSCCRGRGKNIVRALTAPLRRPLTLIKRTSVQYYQNHKPPHDFYAARAVSPAGLTKCFDLLLFGRNHESPSALSCMHCTVGVVSQPAGPAAFD